ncbi:hypothetical protein SAMN05421857_3047 [Chryseobacterium formosense]|uniref:hypothetical protein n=1 Tax=Chryseobacterium formosense TaxID=236814 RepID=UPI0008EAE60A|nr:hypothetical protein [Chryseobacterium formosense]SFT75452.1 hypothetical protein SAMN05421857_3047 [Chryseobacterium formosense]
MKLIGKTKEEIIAVMGQKHFERSDKNYLVYSFRILFFFKRKMYIEFNDKGIAHTVYTL